MRITKIKDTYNDYRLEISWAQLQVFAQALEQSHDNVVGDEVHAELQYYLSHLPGPGEDEEEIRAKEKQEGEPVGDEEESPIPMPPGQDAGTPPDMGEEEPGFPPEAGLAPDAGEQEEQDGMPGDDSDLEDEESLVDEPPVSSPGLERFKAAKHASSGKETDRRLPEPPRE